MSVSREQSLYYARQDRERLLVDAIIALNRLDRIDQAIERSASRMKAIAKGRKPDPYENDSFDVAAE